MTKEYEALVEYRLEQAHESLESAELLLANGKYRPSVNRSYYAMFYAVLALLAKAGRETSKHSSVLSLFNTEFVKTGIFDKELSRWLQEAFDLRQRADYREMFTISPERTKGVLEHAGAFVAMIKKQLRKTKKE